MPTSLTPAHYLRSRVPPNLIPSTQKPDAHILWVGCSDSGFAETKSLHVLPEEIIVHRNPGCVLSNGDLSTSSSLEYALRILEVKHIIVCGHYDCRLVNVGISDSSMRDWLKDLKNLYSYHQSELESIRDLDERNRRLVDLHAWSQAQSILKNPGVAEAQKSRGLKVHAFVYDGVKEECVELVSAVDAP